MPRVIYLDTNQFVRVFERESESLFPRFAETVKRYDWKPAISEGNILEIYQGAVKGADINKIRAGLELVESLNPLWLRIGGLEIREIQTAYSQYQNGSEFTAINPFLSWREFLAGILASRDITVLIDLAASGASGAFDTLYRNNRLIRRDNYWQSELNIASAYFRRITKGQRREVTLRDNFIETILHTCKSVSADSRQVRRFAEELWGLPAICPSFRLSYEVTVSLLADNQSAWTTNRFFDQKHLSTIPYVDMFVGIDRGQRHAVAEFDRRVGDRVGINYSSRCYRLIEHAIDSQTSYA